MKALNLIQKDSFKIIGGASLFALALVLDALAYTAAASVCCIIALLFSGLDVYIDAARGIWRRDFLDEKFNIN